MSNPRASCPSEVSVEVDVDVDSRDHPSEVPVDWFGAESQMRSLPSESAKSPLLLIKRTHLNSFRLIYAYNPYLARQLSVF